MLSMKLRTTIAAGAVALIGAASAASAQAATFTVVTTANSGGGSLRSAINAAETGAGADTIVFDIPGGGVRTITPASPLPVISQPVTIDGYSQKGATEATANAPAQPKIVLDAVNVARGLDIGGDAIEVRGLDVQRAQDTGIYVEGRQDVIAGNHIGTNAAGTLARPNGRYGLQIFGGGNTIGGPDPADRNVVAANPDIDVYVAGGSSHMIQGNRIGTTADGAGVLGAGAGVGVQLDGPVNQVRDNLIAGELNGVDVTSDDNVLLGNDIGTDAGATVALANFIGVNVLGGDRNVIGGTAERAGNVISGNDASGLQLVADSTGDPAEDNRVQNNLIGTTGAGDAPLPNGGFASLPGVVVSGSGDNTIGGGDAGAGNVISGNAGDGIELLAGADGNSVLANSIGTDRTGALDLGNGGSGVEVNDGANNRVGDTPASAGQNTIAHNGDDGVTVRLGAGNAVVRNSIHDNDGLGIDLRADGATANDGAPDSDPGPNGLQNGPEVDSAGAAGVEWSLGTEPGTKYRLEFYANDTCSGGSVSQAQTYLGSRVVTTDANGNADGTSAIAAPAGTFVTMTATHLAPVVGGLPVLTLEPRATSEISPCEAVV